MSNLMNILSTWVELPKYYTDYYYHYLTSFLRLIDQSHTYYGAETTDSMVNFVVNVADKFLILFVLYLVLQVIRQSNSGSGTPLVAGIILACVDFAPYFYYTKVTFDVGLFGLVLWPIGFFTLFFCRAAAKEELARKFRSPIFLVLGVIFGYLALNRGYVLARFVGHGIAIALAILFSIFAKTGRVVTFIGSMFAFFTGYCLLYGLNTVLIFSLLIVVSLSMKAFWAVINVVGDNMKELTEEERAQRDAQIEDYKLREERKKERESYLMYQSLMDEQMAREKERADLEAEELYRSYRDKR